MIGITWVHAGTGVKLPVRAIADRLAGINERRPGARRVLLVLDGVHGFGVEATPVSQLGLRPLRLGLPQVALRPTGDRDRLGPPGGEQRWALAPAFEFHAALGRERVQQRILELTEQLKSGLREIDGVRVRTPADPEISAGIVCFKLDSADPDQAVSRLRERGVHVSVAPYATRNLRAGATLSVDEAGIERALAEIVRLARA